MVKYFRERKKQKLYQQWVERASLSPDDIPRESTTEDMMPPENKQKPHFYLLYILLGVAVVVLITGLVFLVLYSS